MRHTLLLLAAFWLTFSTAHAQMERTIYQVFEVDSMKTVDLDVAGLYEIHHWAGSSVLAEINIQIWHASPQILQELIKLGRYDLKADTLAPDVARISTKVRDRKPLKTHEGECVEIATTKFFVPDTFVWTDDKKRLTRK